MGFSIWSGFIANLIDEPQEAERNVWTAKAFHGYIGDTYQIEWCYETIVRFFINRDMP